MDRRFLTILILPLLLVVFSGCAGSAPHLQRYKNTEQAATCRIGVLPILNHSDFSQGATILYRIILAQLVEEQQYRVALEGDVTDIYRDLHLRPWLQPTPEQMQIIASRLDVDILIGGLILEMKEAPEGGRINPHLKLQLHVYDGEQGVLLWSTYHEAQGTDYRKIMHFGIHNTVSQLSNTIIKEIFELWKEEALLHCQN